MKIKGGNLKPPSSPCIPIIDTSQGEAMQPALVTIYHAVYGMLLVTPGIQISHIFYLYLPFPVTPCNPRTLCKLTCIKYIAIPSSGHELLA